MVTVLASAAVAVLLTFGVALVAAGAGGIGIYATLDNEDRGAMRGILRHPWRTVFSEHDHADADVEEDDGSPGGR
jgi:hypothetical protein